MTRGPWLSDASSRGCSPLCALQRDFRLGQQARYGHSPSLLRRPGTWLTSRAQVPLLRQARAVEALKEAMASAEAEKQQTGDSLSQTHTGVRLAGMMAIARLVDASDLPSLTMTGETLSDGVEALQYALQGRAWSHHLSLVLVSCHVRGRASPVLFLSPHDVACTNHWCGDMLTLWRHAYVCLPGGVHQSSSCPSTA